MRVGDFGEELFSTLDLQAGGEAFVIEINWVSRKKK